MLENIMLLYFRFYIYNHDKLIRFIILVWCNCISFLLTGSDNGEANVVLHPTERRQPSVIPDSPERPGKY